ncbi:MAG: enoyl-CoA hydratase/isomerase family protein [Deltaproteobacteria bacterium]|nr:enoyl-CoA hydratase/isomerase family protein [Deltaproteobacteria bacterium]
MAFETILYEKREGVAFLTLNRPQALNARNRQMRREMVAALQDARADEGVRVLILTGAGDRAFSVGRDLKEAAQESGSLVEGRRARHQENDTLVLATLDKPTIAAIHGYALGGGCELALACDIRVASEDAQLGLPEVSRGMIPGSGGTQRLPRLVGMGRALELILTGEPVDAREAYRIGLVNRVVPRSELLPTAEKIARTIASRAPVALRYAKEAVVKGVDLPLEEGLRLEGDLSWLLRTTEDLREGARAFVEKRPPNWKGR